MEGQITWHTTQHNRFAEFVVGEVQYTIAPEHPVFVDPAHREAVRAKLMALDPNGSVEG